MRPLYLSVIPVDTFLVLLALPSFIALAILSLLSKEVQAKFEEMFGEVE